MLHKRNLKHQRSTSLDTPTQDEKTNPHLKTSLCLKENSHLLQQIESVVRVDQ